MKRLPRSINGLLLVAAAILAAGATAPACAQQRQADGALPSIADYLNRPLVEDWTHHHVVFSNPGTLEEARRNGKENDWWRIVSDYRYRMQWVKRYGASLRRPAHDSLGFANPPIIGRHVPVPGQLSGEKIHGDWAHKISRVDFGVAIDTFPAKYTFAPIGAPDCTNDFVVFPIDTNGSPTQADIVAVNNLYEGTCPAGLVPSVLFSYQIGTGDVQTSPVLSLDGTKVAFVESVTGGSNLHVLTIDKSGNAGCPSSPPCNGTDFNAPAIPGVNNSAVDFKILLNGSVTVTKSSPFVDYTNDVAYVGDDNGVLHKFTGVFLGTPAEVTTAPWPFTVASGVRLTGPVFDSGASQNIFVGGSDGNIYCVTSAGAFCSTPSLDASVNTGPGPVTDDPIVDSTAQTVFVASADSRFSWLTQATTSLGSPVRVNMGATGTDLYNGAFDHAYLTDVSTGHMYFCGNLTNAATPVLMRVTFNSSGTMSSTTDGNAFQLVVSGLAGRGEDCTPLSEAFNSSQGIDHLFLGVTANGFTGGTPNCANDTCIMSFSLPTAAPFTFPTGPAATGTNATLNLGSFGISAIIVDGFSSAAGASQVYFGNLEAGTGVQASQSALQ